MSNKELMALTGALIITAISSAYGAAILGTARPVDLPAYIKMMVQQSDTGGEQIPAALAIAPVEMKKDIITGYPPGRVFKGDFAEQFRAGAMTYFSHVGMFTEVKPDGGDLSLAIKIIKYEAGGNTNPAHQKIALMVEIDLNNTKLNKSMLYGNAGSKVNIPVKSLFQLTHVSRPEGGETYIAEIGAVRFAEISLRIFENIKGKIEENRPEILKSLK